MLKSTGSESCLKKWHLASQGVQGRVVHLRCAENLGNPTSSIQPPSRLRRVKNRPNRGVPEEAARPFALQGRFGGVPTPEVQVRRVWCHLDSTWTIRRNGLGRGRDPGEESVVAWRAVQRCSMFPLWCPDVPIGYTFIGGFRPTMLHTCSGSVAWTCLLLISTATCHLSWGTCVGTRTSIDPHRYFAQGFVIFLWLNLLAWGICVSFPYVHLCSLGHDLLVDYYYSASCYVRSDGLRLVVSCS